MPINEVSSSHQAGECDREFSCFQENGYATEPADGFDDTATAECGYGVSRPAEALSGFARAQQTLSRATMKQLHHELRRGWRAILSLEIQEAFEIAATIEPTLADLPHPVSGQLLSEIHMLRAVGCALTDRSTTALALAERAQRGPLAPRLRRLARTVTRFGFLKGGDSKQLYAMARNRPIVRVSRRSALTDVFDLSIEAAAELQGLKLSSARRLASDAHDMARARLGDSSMAGSFAAVLVGQIAYEEGDLDRAERILLGTLHAPPGRVPIESLLRAYPVFARIALHRGKPSDAIRILREGERLGEANGSTRLVAACLDEQVGIYIEGGALDDARTCLDRLSALSPRQHRDTCGRRSRTEMHRALAATRLALTAAPTRAQAAELRQLQQDALEWNDAYASVGVALRLVEALQILGEAHDAAAMLARTLRLAMDTGIFQTFVDGGRHVRALLIGMHRDMRVDQSDLMPFLSSIVRRLPFRPVQRCLPRSVASTKKVLTRRECLVMKLIGHGLSNKHIARELQIAPETVKSHAKHIFVKLSVQTRAEAVARAAGLRLI